MLQECSLCSAGETEAAEQARIVEKEHLELITTSRLPFDEPPKKMSKKKKWNIAICRYGRKGVTK